MRLKLFTNRREAYQYREAVLVVQGASEVPKNKRGQQEQQHEPWAHTVCLVTSLVPTPPCTNKQKSYEWILQSFLPDEFVLDS
jgi:hypothetical protein